jgi:hypothetical protein
MPKVDRKGASEPVAGSTIRPKARGDARISPAQRGRAVRRLRRLADLLEKRSARDDGASQLNLCDDERDQLALWIGTTGRIEPLGRGDAFRFIVCTPQGWLVLLESDRLELLADVTRRFLRARAGHCTRLEALLSSRP